MQNVQKCCSKIVELIKEGHFGVGSMAPKIQAAIDFVKDGGGKGNGTPHKVYKNLKNGMPSDKEITQYACFKCEMMFDEE